MTGDFRLLEMLKFPIAPCCGIPLGALVEPFDAGDPSAFVCGSGSTRCRIPFDAIISIDDAKPHGGNAITVRLGGGPSDRRETFCNSLADRFRREYKAWLDRVKQAKGEAAEKPFDFKVYSDSVAYATGRGALVIPFARVVDTPACYEDGRYRVLERRDSDSLLVPHRLTPAQFAAFAAAYLAWRSRPKAETDPHPEVFSPSERGGKPFAFADVIAIEKSRQSPNDRLAILNDGTIRRLGATLSLPRFEREYAAWKARQAKAAAERMEDEMRAAEDAMIYAGPTPIEAFKAQQAKPDPDAFRRFDGAVIRFASVVKIDRADESPVVEYVDGNRLRTWRPGYGDAYGLFIQEYNAWRDRQSKPANQPARDGWHWYRTRPESPWRLAYIIKTTEGRIVRGAWLAAGHSPIENHRGEWRPCDDLAALAFIQAATNPGGATTWADPK